MCYSSPELQDINAHELNPDIIYEPERKDCVWLEGEALPVMSAWIKQKLVRKNGQGGVKQEVEKNVSEKPQSD